MDINNLSVPFLKNEKTKKTNFMTKKIQKLNIYVTTIKMS